MEANTEIYNIYFDKEIDSVVMEWDGYATIAIIKPNNYFNKIAVESISYKVDKDKLAINFFDNITEAKEWLKRM